MVGTNKRKYQTPIDIHLHITRMSWEEPQAFGSRSVEEESS